jgi:hypothetical protein
MADAASRTRVERLLRDGDFRADDLTRLFLYARDRCDGRESVQEIGDFVAHHSEKTKGIIARETRDWFITARVMASVAAGNPLQGDRLPSNFPQFLAASLRRFGPAIKQRGIRLREARHSLPHLSEKFITNPDGTLAISPRHTQTERKLIDVLSSHLTARPAFTSDRLFQDFCETLKSNGLMTKAEMRDFAKLEPTISLFAVTVMHNCAIQIGNGLSCKLGAFLNGSPGGMIDVNAPVPTIFNPAILMSSAIYSSGFTAIEYCDETIPTDGTPLDFDIELTAEMKLTKLV